MALRDFIRRKPISKATQAHSGQVKSAARKRARQRANHLELARQAAWCGVTVSVLRQVNQREVDAIARVWQKEITKSAERLAASRAAERRRLDSWNNRW